MMVTDEQGVSCEWLMEQDWTGVVFGTGSDVWWFVEEVKRFLDCYEDDYWFVGWRDEMELWLVLMVFLHV